MKLLTLASPVMGLALLVVGLGTRHAQSVSLMLFQSIIDGSPLITDARRLVMKGHTRTRTQRPVRDATKVVWGAQALGI